MTSINNVHNNSAQTKGIQYDRNEAKKALENAEDVRMERSEDEEGYYIRAYDNETNAEYLLHDIDEDGEYDEYRKTEYDENGNCMIYDDFEFDGTYDRTIELTNEVSKDGTKVDVYSAIDNDADGEVDEYNHMELPY